MQGQTFICTRIFLPLRCCWSPPTAVGNFLLNVPRQEPKEPTVEPMFMP